MISWVNSAAAIWKRGHRVGKYLNSGNFGFQSALNSQIYVDKTGMIEKINRMLGTKQKYLCVSRARRFGKTMAEQMLAAYYGRSCDSREQFHGLAIEQAESFEKHLNKYDVIFIDIQGMWEQTLNAIRFGVDTSIVRYLQQEVIADVKEAFPEAVRDGEMSGKCLRERDLRIWYSCPEKTA